MRRHPVLTTLTIALALGAMVLAVLVALAWWSQERIAYQPPGGYAPGDGEASRISYTASDGQELHGFLVGPRETNAGLLIMFHGNADLAVWQIPWAREVAAHTGRLVLLAEYRGYGGLTGIPTYLGIQRDARAAYDHAIRALGADPARIALFGHSLGSAVAAELAADVPTPVQALVLQSPFTTARDMARIVVSRPVVLAWNAISRIHYDTRAHVRRLETPVWVAHGTRDFIVPYEMGVEVFQAARVKGELLSIDRAGHNDVHEVGGADYWRWMRRALAPD